MGRAGVEPAFQPLDIAVYYKTNNILTNEITNRVLRYSSLSVVIIGELFSKRYQTSR